MAPGAGIDTLKTSPSKDVPAAMEPRPLNV